MFFKPTNSTMRKYTIILFTLFSSLSFARKKGDYSRVTDSLIEFYNRGDDKAIFEMCDPKMKVNGEISEDHLPIKNDKIQNIKR